MLTIILGIVFAVIIGRIGFAIAVRKAHVEFAVFPAMVAVVIALFFIARGVSAPVSGYHDWELTKETELATLSNSKELYGTGTVYVMISADNTYMYKHEIDSKFGTGTSKEYQTVTVKGKGVEVVEDSNCQTPVIQVYQRDAKASIWTFACFTTETQYVFYVPVGTTSTEVKTN